MQREVERLSGVGVVRHESGAIIGPRSYSLVVVQDVLRAGDELLEGTPEIRGVVKLRGHEEAFTLAGASLILTLEDGRELPFGFDSGERIFARGALK